MLSEYEMKLIARFGKDGWSPQEIAQTILGIRNTTAFKSLVGEIKSYLDVVEEMQGSSEK